MCIRDRKITDIQTYPVWGGSRNYTFVIVDTDEGIYGVGESGLTGRELAVAGTIEQLKPWLVGQDPQRIEHLWQQMWRGQFFAAQGVVSAAISAIVGRSSRLRSMDGFIGHLQVWRPRGVAGCTSGIGRVGHGFHHACPSGTSGRPVPVSVAGPGRCLRASSLVCAGPAATGSGISTVGGSRSTSTSRGTGDSPAIRRQPRARRARTHRPIAAPARMPVALVHRRHVAAQARTGRVAHTHRRRPVAAQRASQAVSSGCAMANA